MGKNNACIPNIEPIIAAGIDPFTGRPLKAVEGLRSPYKEGIRKLIRILDEQDAITRYQWYNLPCDLSSLELERLLYYRPGLCLFYSEVLDKFYFMPYALEGNLDAYARYKTIHPVPFTTTGDTTTTSAQAEYLSTLKLEVLYDVPTDTVDPTKVTAILRDYPNQMSQINIPRQQLQEPLIDMMSDCLPFARTALFNSTGVVGMRVNSQDESTNVLAANKSIDSAALNGQRYIPILSNLDFQELTSGKVANSEEFLLYLQALDNLRLGFLGLDNGGLIQKKAHLLQSESDMNSSHARSALYSGLALRQRFCDIVNSVWGIGIWCDISESALGIDKNGDGLAYDQQDQSGSAPGDQPPMQMSEEEE